MFLHFVAQHVHFLSALKQNLPSTTRSYCPRKEKTRRNTMQRSRLYSYSFESRLRPCACNTIRVNVHLHHCVLVNIGPRSGRFLSYSSLILIQIPRFIRSRVLEKNDASGLTGSNRPRPIPIGRRNKKQSGHSNRYIVSSAHLSLNFALKLF